MATSFPFAYSQQTGIQHITYDMIKLKQHQSRDLIQHPSLLMKLLALKADDTGITRQVMVREIMTYVAQHLDALSSDQKLLIDRFVSYYARLPASQVKAIKKETHMTFYAATITEHIQHEARLEGEEIGALKGAIQKLQQLHERGLLSAEVFQAEVVPVREQLAQLEAGA